RIAAIGALLVPNHPVHGDTATDLITVALCHDVGADRGQGRRYRGRPRQGRIDFVGVGVRVEVVDRGGGPWRAEHVIDHNLWVELHDLYTGTGSSIEVL